MTEIKMDPQVKAEWVKTLRSGKYAQGRRRLRSTQVGQPEALCCLGVLCEIAVEQGVIEPPKFRPVFELDENDQRVSVVAAEYERESTVLPREVAEWSGLIDSQGNPNTVGGYQWSKEDENEPYLVYTGALTGDNDGGMTFSEIADIIEREF